MSINEEKVKHVDVGLTHIALLAKDLDASIAFYAHYAKMQVVHERVVEESQTREVWLSDKTRPFAIVLFQDANPNVILAPFSHLGVGCKSKQEVDELCADARDCGILVQEPTDSGYPAGYWALLKDPDGHTLELSYGQEVGFTIESN